MADHTQDDLPLSRRGAIPGPLARRLLPSPVDLLVVTAYLLSLTRPAAHEHLWWQLEAGEWILRNIDVPRVNLFSFTAPEHDWIDHAWLGHVSLFAVADRLGPTWLLFLRGGLFALTIGLLYRLLRRRGGVIPAFVLGAGAVAGLLPGLNTDPMLYASLFLTVLLTLLEDPDWRYGRGLILIPVLFFLWANVHGSFVIGLLLLGAHGLGAYRDGLRRRGPRRLSTYFVVAGMALLTALCNPYYAGVYAVGLEDLWQTLVALPVRLQVLPWFFLILASLVLLGVWLVVAAAGREVRWRLVLPLLVLTPFALLMPDHVALWVPWATVTVMEHIQQIAERVRHGSRGYLERPGSLSRRLRRIADRFAVASTYDRFLARGRYAALMLALALVYFSLPPGAWLRVAGMEVRGVAFEEMLPEGAVPSNGTDFLLGAAFPGARVMVPAVWGGYITFHGHPGVQVFIDSREDAYPLDVMEDYDRFAAALPGWEEVLERYQVDYLIWRAGDFQPRALAATGRWALLFADPVSQVLVRQDGAGDSRPSPEQSRRESGRDGTVATTGLERPKPEEPPPTPVPDQGIFRVNRSGPREP